MKKNASLLVGLLFSAWITVGIENGRAYGHAVAEVASATAKVFFEWLEPDQLEWLKATPKERMRIAERIGKTGAARWAEEQGWQRLMGNKTIPQGVDQIFRAPDGTIRVIEAKGGTSPLGRGYGYAQGSSEWAAEAVKRMLRDPNIDSATKAACEEVFQAAAENRLETVVLRTLHVLGKSGAPIVGQIVDCSDEAGRLAKETLDAIRKGGAAQAASVKTRPNSGKKAGGTIAGQPEKPTGAATKVAETTKTTGEKAATAAAESTAAAARAKSVVQPRPPIANRPGHIPVRSGNMALKGVEMAVEAVDSINETETRYKRGDITEQEREIAYAKNVAGYVGGQLGSLVGAMLWAKEGAAYGAMLGSCVAPGPGTAVGGTMGAAIGGTVGYVVGKEATELAAEQAVRAIHRSGTTVSEWVRQRWEDVQDAGRWTYRKAADTWHWVTGD